MHRIASLTIRRRVVALGSATVVALSLAACGDDDATVPRSATSPSSPATAAPTTPAASPTTPAGIDPLEGASTATVTSEPKNTETALLTAVRAARQEGFDRVVFEFANAVPGYRIGYVERPITEDGSGEEVSVSGDAVLEVRMRNASGADLSKEGAPLTYTGPTRITPPTPQVTELVRTGDFEATLTWAVGVRDKVDLRVTTLESPPRLVIDLRNH